MKRTVTIEALSMDAIEKVKTECEMSEYFDAIGYLSDWALGSFDQVFLWISHSESYGPEITARYLNSVSGRKYDIGAVWRAEEKKFSFHS